jgi:hypothetical protein
MTPRRLAIILLSALLLTWAAAGTAVAQQDPFGPIPQTPPEQPPPAPVKDDGGGLNRTQELLIGAAGLVLLVGIGWAIVRDARNAAPVDRDHPLDDPDRAKGSRTPPERRVKQNRAKAKAARQARKRNR